MARIFRDIVDYGRRATFITQDTNLTKLASTWLFHSRVTLDIIKFWFSQEEGAEREVQGGTAEYGKLIREF